MRLLVLLLAVVLVACQASTLYEQCNDLFASFKTQYKQKYATAEENTLRNEIFCQNMKRADDLNERNGSPAFGVSKYADRNEKEFSVLLGRKGKGKGVIDEKRAVRKPSGKKLEREGVSSSYVNWVEQGVVTPVKNQGQCGSCWAHSVAEQIESAFALQGNSLWEFSPQQIASCTTTCMGCGGGDTIYAYEYIESLPTGQGLGSAAFAPYVQSMYTQCTAASCTEACSALDLSALTNYAALTGYYAQVTGYEYAVPPCTGSCASQNMTLFAENIAEYGPASVCVDASSWNLYTGNGAVVTSATCSSSYHSLDHCVQLTGYNATGPNPYWMVRNSWATDWGNAGFIYLEFDSTNPCGIADEATFVNLAPSPDR